MRRVAKCGDPEYDCIFRKGEYCTLEAGDPEMEECQGEIMEVN